MAVGYHFKDDSRGLAEKPVYEQSFLQAHNLGLRYPACARLFGRSDLLPSPVISCGRKAFGCTSIRRYTNNRGVVSRIFTRMVDTGPLSLPASTTTIWLALVDAPRERGCMAFANGSHRLSPEPEFVDIFNAKGEIPLTDRVDGSEWEWVPVAAGDCTFHSGLTYHRSAANETDQMREAMTIWCTTRFMIGLIGTTASRISANERMRV